MTEPALYALPPGAHFAEAFACGLVRRMDGAPPEAMADIIVLVNTRRSQRAIEEALADQADGPALLPRIALLSELGADPLAEPDLAPAIEPMRRRLRLTRLVEAYLDATEGAAARSAAPELADSLAALLDEMQEEGIDPDSLDGLAPGEMAEHWRRTLEFTDLIRHAWPRIRAEEEVGALDPKDRQRRVIERLTARWREAPPGNPVIAAASTGSVASTAELLAAVARLPEGAVVLPGFDPGVEPAIWRNLGPDHPMAPFRRLLAMLDAEPAEVRPWGEPWQAAPRDRLLAQALRPAPVTDAWVAAAPTLAAEAEEASRALTLVEAENQRLEAGAIALAIRRGLEDTDRRIALVTPDATLARRVTAELDRFGIEPDDSLGKPLALSPAAVFFRLVGRLAEPQASPVDIAALLQHPMTRAGMGRTDHRRHARHYELGVLRERPQPDRPPGTLPVWEKADPEQAAWLAAIEAAIRPLAEAMERGSLSAVVKAHTKAAEALSRESEGDAPQVWQGDDGAALLALLGRIASHADAHGDAPVENWPTLLSALMQGEQLRPSPERPHPRVAIWGTMEARTQAADLVILGGLNEGTWPPAPAADPWLSRPMRAALGLAPPEREIGLSAHDFLQAANKPEVILTRATRIDGTPTVASRWLLRLQNLMAGLGDGAALEAMRARGHILTRLAGRLHRPSHPVPRAPRPEPRPDPADRPDRLSATQVERLIRDAYAIYAEKVLGLKPLDPLGRPANFLDRGTVIHSILERFVEETRDGLPPDAEARTLLMSIAADTLASEIPWPDIRRVWLGRVARFADWFIEGEHERRQAGQPFLIEERGRMTMDIAGRAITLSAQADRIDRLNDGAAAIFDYKSGAPPSAKTIEAGFAHQLHLQAAILMAGGFEGAEAMVPRLGAYIGVNGSSEGGKEVSIALTTDDVVSYREKLGALLEAYARPETAYVSRGGVERVTDMGDYDHLARRWEWEGDDA